MFTSSPPWCFALVAELVSGKDGTEVETGTGCPIVGYALCNRAYSSWTRRAFFLEDLYVRPEARSLGIGHKLFAKLCQIGASQGVSRIDGHVLESNKEARAFYENAGARCLLATEGRTAMRLDSAHIRRIVASTDESHIK